MYRIFGFRILRRRSLLPGQLHIPNDLPVSNGYWFVPVIMIVRLTSARMEAGILTDDQCQNGLSLLAFGKYTADWWWVRTHWNGHVAGLGVCTIFITILHRLRTDLLIHRLCYWGVRLINYGILEEDKAIIESQLIIEHHVWDAQVLG